MLTSTGIVYENLPVEIDEQTLTQIAITTGGMYFRATDENGLRAIYKEIAQLEKRKITHKVVQADPPPTPQAFLNWSIVLMLIYLCSMTLLYLPDLND